MVLAVALMMLAASPLRASDVVSNVAPGSQVTGLAGRYPLGNYALDHHFSAVSAGVFSGVDVSGVPALIAYFLADVIWQLTAFLANALIALFTFAFSLDLVNGSPTSAGALAPVSRAVNSIYTSTFGQSWLVLAVVLAGLWAMWRALIQRRYAETAGALGLSVIFCVIALAFVTQPQRTIGAASHLTNQMSGAFLALSNRGQITSGEQAKRAAADQLFALLVYQPWVVLNYGGVEHCVRHPSSGSEPVSVPVRPLSSDPASDAQLAARLRGAGEVQTATKTCINNQTKYAQHFLAYAPESSDRDAEYDALRNADTAKLPDSDPSKRLRDYHLSAADKPAADAMGKGGQYQRLLMAVVIFAAELGAFLLLGALSVGVILAQVLVLVLLAFAPVALVVGIYPGRGHDFFRGWLTRLAGFLLRKAIYSLILAVLLAVLAAVGDASSQLGWLLSFGLQAGFLWAVFLYRRQLTGQLLAATAGGDATQRSPFERLATLYYARQLLHTPRRRLRHRANRTQTAAASGHNKPPEGDGGRGSGDDGGPGGDPPPEAPSPSPSPSPTAAASAPHASEGPVEAASARSRARSDGDQAVDPSSATSEPERPQAQSDVSAPQAARAAAHPTASQGASPPRDAQLPSSGSEPERSPLEASLREDRQALASRSARATTNSAAEPADEPARIERPARGSR